MMDDWKRMTYPAGEVFDIKARRCRRCGGILTSAEGLASGYGACCFRKMKQEAAEKELMRSQCSLFEEG